MTRDEAGTDARVIGSIARVLTAATDPGAVLAAMTDPAIRIVSLTVTEKAYCLDRAAGSIDAAHPAIIADLDTPKRPESVPGFLVEALRLRRKAGIAPFTVLCCDNLPNNGALLKRAVVDYALLVDPDLGDWIEAVVAFPCTMVDRITPAPTEETLALAADFTGCTDLAAVETEAFTQWVIEDDFPTGRPDWEAGGALFVTDVSPYEHMKLRMLNGAHSLMAYAGYLAGHRYTRDVMGDEPLVAIVTRYMECAAATLKPLQGIEFADYARQLLARFRNPAIAHETYQIAMDGTEKMPQRIGETALAALRDGIGTRPMAFAMAAWMRYCLGRREDGTGYALRDPREQQIEEALSGAGDNADAIYDALHGLPGVFDAELTGNARWRAEVTEILAAILRHGIARAIRDEAG
jgi:fructuronate reductase